MPYLGNEPAVAYTSTTKDSFSGDASTTDFTLSKSANVNAVRVVVENVVQDPGVAYTCSGTTLTFTSAPPTGTNNIYVVHLGPPAATVAPPSTINNPTTFGDGADIITASKGTDNVRLGEGAGTAIESGGNENVAIGKDALTANTTGDANTAVGFSALTANTTGLRNTAVGRRALVANTTGDDNDAFGRHALEANTTGSQNVAIGRAALASNTTANGNTAVGYSSLITNITGTENVAVGYEALKVHTASEATAFGYQAGASNTSGSNLTAIGKSALTANTTGGSNTALGIVACAANTTGNSNTGLGTSALRFNTSGDYNTAVGQKSLFDLNGGNRNTAVGYEAGSNITTGSFNSSLGYYAGGNQTTGDYNVSLGYNAAPNQSTASNNNTCVGSFSGYSMGGNADDNVFVGYLTTANSSNADGQVCIGNNITSIGSYNITLGQNSSGRVYNNYASNATWTRTSDERIKKDIQTNTDCGLDFINDLRTVTYKWKAPSEHPEDFVSYNADQTEAKHTEKMYGFIAQEVKAAMDAHSITDFSGWNVVEGNGDQQGVSYEMFVMPLVKAVQELSAKVTTLETENTAIKARLDALEAG